jgi:hypothetical protein
MAVLGLPMVAVSNVDHAPPPSFSQSGHRPRRSSYSTADPDWFDPATGDKALICFRSSSPEASVPG